MRVEVGELGVEAGHCKTPSDESGESMKSKFIYLILVSVCYRVHHWVK